MRNSSKLWIIILATLFLALPLVIACSDDDKTEGISPTPPVTTEPPDTQNTVIPDFIIAKSDAFIISKVGATYFADYFKYDSSNSKYYPPDSFCIDHPSDCMSFAQHPYYLMVYTFRIPEKPWIDELVDFVVDSEGNIITEREPYGIPECLSNPSCCTFTIDQSMAENIAKQYGLEQGIKPWDVSFNWYGRTINNYVWGITSYLTDMSGYSLLIDANSGKVLQKLDWGGTP